MIVGRLNFAEHALIYPILVRLPLHVALRVPVTDKLACLKAFVNIVCHLNGIDSEKKKDMINAILRRERLGTTGVGAGFAMPHGKCDIDSIYIILGTLENAIDFDAIDDSLVDVVFMEICPNSSGADHLKLLGLFSRLLRNKNTTPALRSAMDLQEVGITLREFFLREFLCGNLGNRETAISSLTSLRESLESSILCEGIFAGTDWEALISSQPPEKRRIGGGKRAKARR